MNRARGLVVAGALLLVLLASGCAGEEGDLQPVAGTWRLDRADYARRLMAVRAREGQRNAADALDAEARAQLAEECRTLAASLHLTLDLSADGQFVVRMRAGREESRYGGSWSRTGNQLGFETTHAPTGEVTTVPPVEAVLTREGLLFSGWLVPHDFLLRRVP